MTDKLPHNLIGLFTPRPQPKFLYPIDHPAEKRHTSRVDGLGQALDALKEYKDNDNYEPTESWLQRRDRKIQESKEKQEKLKSDAPQNYKPDEDPAIRGDPYKTLFVSRMSYDTEERDLERELGRYGPIERVSPRILYRYLPCANHNCSFAS